MELVLLAESLGLIRVWSDDSESGYTWDDRYGIYRYNIAHST